MSKAKLNIALKSLKKDKNNAIAYLYQKPSFGKGALNGFICTIKDIYATKDEPTMASSKILEKFVANYDAEIVTRLKKNGAAIVAKTHLDELAFGGTGTFSAWGIIKNPLDKTRIVGGSSSGAAATFNQEITIAIGSDTGDSVRCPASFIGKVGFKPSYGAISRYGMMPFASSLDTVAWFSHNVNDTITISKVLFGKDQKDMVTKKVPINNVKISKPKKVVFLNLAKFCKPYVSKQYQKLINKFKQSKIDVTMLTLDKHLLNLTKIVYWIISYSEAVSNDSNLNGITFGKRFGKNKTWEDIIFNTRSNLLGKMVQRRFTLGSFFLEKKHQVMFLQKAQKIRRLITNLFRKHLSQNDLLIFPSTGEIAPKFEEPRLKNFVSNILINANLSGHPSITLPWGKYQGLPYGIQLEANLYQDQKLLSFALWVEKLLQEDEYVE